MKMKATLSIISIVVPIKHNPERSIRCKSMNIRQSGLARRDEGLNQEAFQNWKAH